MSVRPAGPDEEGRVAAFLEESGNLVGVLTYRIDDSGCEVTALYTAVSWHGLGSALLEAVESSARAAGCDRLWLVTTNDNVDAFRFYQRRGFRLTDLRHGAVERSRTSLKPSIPEIGDHGIPIRDELLLERRIWPARPLETPDVPTDERRRPDRVLSRLLERPQVPTGGERRPQPLIGT